MLTEFTVYKVTIYPANPVKPVCVQVPGALLTAEGVKIVTYATVLYFVVLCRVRKDGVAWHCFAWCAVLANQKTPMLNC